MLLVAGSARAEDGDAAPARDPDAGDAIVPTLAAIVPGVLAHGAGPFVAGDRETGLRLLTAQAAGFGVMLIGGVPIALTGASRTTIAPLYATFLAGLGTIGVTGLSNLYGGLSPAFRPGTPITVWPALELTAGWQGVFDVRLGDTQQLALGARAWLERVRLEGEARAGLTTSSHRLRVSGAWRGIGPMARATPGRRGSFLEVEASALYEPHYDAGFTLWTCAIDGRGRLDLALVGDSLDGSFAEVALGSGLQGFLISRDADVLTQLRFQALWGVYFGRRGGPLRGEAALFYEHRKDDYAGAFKTTFIVFGHVGARTRLYFAERWGLVAEVATGGARVANASVLYRFGDLQ